MEHRRDGKTAPGALPEAGQREPQGKRVVLSGLDDQHLDEHLERSEIEFLDRCLNHRKLISRF